MVLAAEALLLLALVKPGGKLFQQLPGIARLTLRYTAYYVDAGARDLGATRGAHALKIAVLRRSHDGSGSVVEEVYHPKLVLEGREAPPVFVGSGGDEVKSIATYIAELASLLAIVETGGRLPGVKGDVDRNGCLLLIRHGPLVAPLHYHITSPLLERDYALRLLSYAGLSIDTAHSLVEMAEVCGGDSSRHMISAGLLALAVLDRLVRKASEAGAVVAGVVEDVSRSKALARRILAENVAEVLVSKGGDLGSAIDSLADTIVEAFRTQGARISRCLGVDVSLNRQALLDSLANLLGSIRSVLVMQERIHDLAGVKPLDVEVALAHGGLTPDVNDADLFYALYHLESSRDKPATKPVEWLLRLRLAVRVASSSPRTKCHTWTLEVLERPPSIYYQYITPHPPPTCSDIERALKGAGLAGIEPYSVAEAWNAPPPVRVEYYHPGATECVEALVALTAYPAAATVYGYPPQLLLVDRHSRITPPEAAGLRGLAEQLASSLRPYSMYLRSWRRRILSQY